MRLRAAISFAALMGVSGAGQADDSRVPESPAFEGVQAFLQTRRVSGALRADYFHAAKRPDQGSDLLGVTAQIKTLPELGERIDGKLEARITNPALNRDGASQSRLLEGFVTLHLAQADLRIGKQIVAWGRADGINPTDNLTPRDYTVLLPFEDDQRFGTTAIKLDTYLSPQHTLTVFISPFFKPAMISLPTAGRTLRETTPARTLANSELGLKLDKIGEGLDGSISYFHGFSLLPDLRLLGSNPVEPILESHYDRINVLGADFARNFGRFAVRGEAAYVDTRDTAGDDPGIKNPYLFWIIGIDRTFFEEMNVNVQFFQRRVRRYHAPEGIADLQARAVALLNALIDGQRDRISNGISFRVSNKWFNNTLEAEVFAVLNLTRRDRFIRPLLTYAFTDHWKGTVGAEVYGGAADTQFGSLKPRRGVFAELRYGF
ncbi:MAG: hypothetical protein HY066_09355 [Betaproteobacteria bacterium]|nr:hypothetical protein [Betaproteobacteria bacterium]